MAGHYCVQVELVWPDDADPSNNLGQTNLDVKALNSPNASFTFPLRNDGFHAAPLRLEVDAYHLPPLESCGKDATGRRLSDRLRRHLPAANLLPAGWKVDISGAPDEDMSAGEERPITVKDMAPDGFAGSQDINVNAFDRERRSAALHFAFIVEGLPMGPEYTSCVEASHWSDLNKAYLAVLLSVTAVAGLAAVFTAGLGDWLPLPHSSRRCATFLTGCFTGS